jgi:hypothetical protein
VKGRNALRRHCAEMFAAFEFSLVTERILYGENHWTLEWAMVLSLAEPDGGPFTARVDMLDVVTVNARREVVLKDVYWNGKQAEAALQGPRSSASRPTARGRAASHAPSYCAGCGCAR